MPSYSRAILSGSPDSGRPIPTGTSAKTIHTVPGGVQFDEVHLWATNVTNTAATMTLAFGGTTDPDDHLVDTVTIPANSLPIPIVTGQSLAGAAAITASCSVDGAINLSGYVNRIS